MIAYLAVLLLAAFVVWAIITYRRLDREYLEQLARETKRTWELYPYADEWERPRIIRVEGGIYDGAGDF